MRLGPVSRTLGRNRRHLSELPYLTFGWASYRRGKFTAKIDAIKWVVGGDADFFKERFHFLGKRVKRQNSNCKHTVGSVGYGAFVSNRLVNVLHKYRSRIATRPFLWRIRSFPCAKSEELRIVPIIIGRHDLDPKKSVVIAIFKIGGSPASSTKSKIGAVPRVVPVDYLVTNPSFMLFL